LLGLPFHPNLLDLLLTHLTPALSPLKGGEGDGNVGGVTERA
jgi:hypothetical protein